MTSLLPIAHNAHTAVHAAEALDEPLLSAEAIHRESTTRACGKRATAATFTLTVLCGLVRRSAV